MTFIDFRIAGENLDLDEITQTLKMTPDFACKKGTETIVRNEVIIAQEDTWYKTIKVDSQEMLTGNLIEQKISELINTLYEEVNYITILANNNSITLWVTIYAESYQTNLHFAGKTIQMIADLGIDMDFTFMSLEDIYKGNY